jgi:hypothetical protein
MKSLEKREKNIKEETMSKKNFSKIFPKKNVQENMTIDPKVYAQLYKDLKFPRDDYTMQVNIVKKKPIRRKS